VYLRGYDAVTFCIATRYQWLSGVVDRLGGCGVSSLSLRVCRRAWEYRRAVSRRAWNLLCCRAGKGLPWRCLNC